MNTSQETPKKKLHVSADKIRTLDMSAGEHDRSVGQQPPHQTHPPEEIRDASR